MRKLLYILLLFGSIVQAQFSPMVGVIASQGESAINYSIANATYSNKSYDPAEITALEDGAGLNGFVYLFGHAAGWQYTQSDMNDITTMSYNSSTLSDSYFGQARAGIDISADGKNINSQNYGSAVWTVPFSTANDLTTYGTSTVTGLSGTTGTNARGWATNADGTKLWGIDTNTHIIYEFDISPAWTGTPTYNSKSVNMSVNFGQAYGMSVSPDGLYMIIGDNTSDTLKQFVFGTIGDITTLTYDNISISVGSQDTATYGGWYSEQCYMMIGLVTDKIYQYNLNN